MDFSSLHPTFPLVNTVLNRHKLPPSFQYSKIENARRLLHDERLSGTIAPSAPVYASDLAGIGLLGRIHVRVTQHYLSHFCPALLQDIDTLAKKNISKKQLLGFLNLFLSSYPSPQHDPRLARTPFISSTISGISNRQSLYLSFLLVHLIRENPAAAPYQPLFLAPDILNHPLYTDLINTIESSMSDTPLPFMSGENLLSLLRKPSRLHPHSIYDQLSFIRGHWKKFLPEDLHQELSRSLDNIKEEKRNRGGFPDQPPVVRPPFPDQLNRDSDERHFSQDEDWMSNAVLIAKNIYVWLDQLSKKHRKNIETLDAIPYPELEELSQYGINCLWLIGIWERSPASREIKQRCGNPDAIPSAYSIYDYVIADDLGGDQAFQHLKDSASHAGLRLAADMVPNHMGIYSRWIHDHPQRFLQLDHKPFPGYTYTGPDLSPSDQISIYLEDHYYQQSDAAVVFKRVDHASGETSYIYHGNDGTAMPWNDTAQLNFLRKDVREAVINTILEVADQFPVIRFDAAMTLAKKHYQRLWFPPPGEGGAIPTRAEHGLSKKEFEKRFPQEFWRQVVKRVSAERPQTLLIAEAFWMMEGYFVRSLGMHRVYNSAFMHMLRDEKNAKYRNLLIKTLNYDPGILKRYVNFMTNPDEETAVAQFGKGGKYFGICILMCTLPGTPMFGHGQIEGYHEKYGMEYHQAYYDESPDAHLLEEHHQKIFPLLQQRHVFSQSEHFILYDFITNQGNVDENVFVYSNRHGGQSALVVYHNKWDDTKGSILKSCIDSKRRVGPSLGLDNSGSSQDMFVTFSDLVTGNEFLIPSKKFFDEGLNLSLGAYECRVYHQFKQVRDNEHNEYHDLYAEIGSCGVSNLENSLSEIRYQNASGMWVDILRVLFRLGKGKRSKDISLPIPDISHDSNLQAKLKILYSEVLRKNQRKKYVPDELLEKITVQGLSYLKCFTHQLFETFPLPAASVTNSVHTALVMWAVMSPLFDKLSPSEIHAINQIFINHFQQHSELRASDAQRLKLALEILVDHQPAEQLTSSQPAFDIGHNLLDSFLIQDYLGVHTYQDTRYYHKESFDEFIYLYFCGGVAHLVGDENQDPAHVISMLRDTLQDILAASNQSSYRFDVFIKNLHHLTT